MKLNNKGYMIIEIVMAAMITFGIAYFLFDLTINIKDKSDNMQARTIIMSDRGIIENYIMGQLKKAEFDSIKCFDDGTLEFKSKQSNNSASSTTSHIYIATDTDNKRKLMHKENENIIYKKQFSDYIMTGISNGVEECRLQCSENNEAVTITIYNTMKATKENYDIILNHVKKG